MTKLISWCKQAICSHIMSSLMTAVYRGHALTSQIWVTLTSHHGPTKENPLTPPWPWAKKNAKRFFGDQGASSYRKRAAPPLVPPDIAFRYCITLHAVTVPLVFCHPNNAPAEL